MANPKTDPSSTGWGGLWATIFTLLSLTAASVLVFVALASSSWFEYDAEFSDNIDVPLLEAEDEGFEMTKVASVFRYLIYACLVGFVGLSAILVLYTMKMASWENRPVITLFVIFITMLLIIAFASVFVVRGGLSRREEYDVTTSPHSTTTTTTGTGTTGSTTTTHKAVVVTYFGDASRFSFTMPFWSILIATILMLLVVLTYDGFIAYLVQMGPTPWVVNKCGMALNSVSMTQGKSYK